MIRRLNKIERDRKTDRDQLLESLKAALTDPRIDAAWLFGSFGRGDADAWSDLDVVIVVADDFFDDYLAGRYDLVSKLGKVVLKFESSYNGPPGGCYLMTGYDSPTGILLVDWYWQPRSVARKTHSEAVLVMNHPVAEYDNSDGNLISMWQRPENVKPLSLWNPTPDQDRANGAALAWAMLAIQAKAVVRKPEETSLTYQEFIESLIAKAGGTEPDGKRYRDPSALRTSQDRIHRLESIAGDLQNVSPAFNAAYDSVMRFFASVKTHCESKHQRTNP